MSYPAPMSDEKLIRFYLNGNPGAMATLVELYKDRVYSTVYGMVQNRYAAEDIFRDVFIRIINNLLSGKMAEEGNFLQWANAIAQELCMEHIRISKLAIVIDNYTETGSAATNTHASAAALPGAFYHESHGRIKSMIDLLPDEQREVMVLNHYAGRSFREITEIMKCSLTSALDTMGCGLHNLRRMMMEREMVLS